MNWGRLSTNLDKFPPKINSIADYDISTLTSLYDFGPQLELINISNGYTVTPVQFYAVIPNSDYSKAIFLKTQEKLAKFFSYSEPYINRGLKINRIYLKNNISYTIVKIF